MENMLCLFSTIRCNVICVYSVTYERELYKIFCLPKIRGGGAECAPLISAPGVTSIGCRPGVTNPSDATGAKLQQQLYADTTTAAAPRG